MLVYPDSKVASPTDVAQAVESAGANDGRDADNVLRFAFAKVENEPTYARIYSCERALEFKTCTGLFANVVSFFAEHLNMTVRSLVGTNGELGRQLPNGSWTGATGDMIRGDADLSIAGWSASRCAVTTCLDYLAYVNDAVLVPLPKRKLFIKAFTQPFTAEVWICLVVAFLSMGLYLRATKRRCYPFFDWLKLFGTVLGNDIPQDTGFGQQGSISHQFFPLSTWYAGMAFLSMSYSALVIGYFTDPLEPRVRTLSQLLAQQPRLDVQVNPHMNFLIVYLRASAEPDAKDLAARMREVPVAAAYSFFPEAGRQAYVDDSMMLWSKVEHAERTGDGRWDEFYILNRPGLFPAPLAYRTVFFRRDFPRMAHVWRIWTHYNEHGFHVRNEKTTYKVIAAKMEAATRKKKTEDHEPTSMEHIYGIFVLLMIGNLVAALAFIAEILRENLIVRKKA